VQTAPPCVQLGLTAEERHRAQVDLHRIGVGRPAFLHPGAGASWKRWPAQNFALLAAALLERGYDPVLIEGPADRDAVAQVQERVTRCLPVVRERSVRELAALLSQEALFVGNDSGVTHLAAAAGALTLALFGPTDPASWRPLGDVRVLRACTACTVRQGQIRVCDDPACMEGIAVEHVLHLLG
jgi:ADP-heptose:LPS heptosyltransferase